MESAFAKASADGIYKAYHGLAAAKIAGWQIVGAKVFLTFFAE